MYIISPCSRETPKTPGSVWDFVARAPVSNQGRGSEIFPNRTRGPQGGWKIIPRKLLGSEPLPPSRSWYFSLSPATDRVRNSPGPSSCFVHVFVQARATSREHTRATACFSCRRRRRRRRCPVVGSCVPRFLSRVCVRGARRSIFQAVAHEKRSSWGRVPQRYGRRSVGRSVGRSASVTSLRLHRERGETWRRAGIISGGDGGVRSS